ncbi:hypothetical protein FRC20_004488 [Serendipita sp. 405]|nr:hypothetical protein FRC20_004488 [Serendipita sp. 405]
MEEPPEILRFGAELKDQVDLIHGVTESQLGLLQEIRDVIRERANLEKDYSTKLLALTKKAQEKKAKRMLGVVLGQEPSKQYTDDTIRTSTLDVALQAFLTSWEETANLHSTFASELGNAAEQATSAIAKVDITRDQNLFIAFNLRHFTPPPDWKFEACASYYDTGTINTEPGPKVFLQNRFTRAQAKLEEAKGLMQTKDQEANGVRVQVAKEIADEKTDKYLELRHQVTQYNTSVVLIQKELEVLSTALGGDVGAQQPHNFKSSTFSIPATCEYCHSSIWGLAKQGKTCKSCGISVHARCEMKIPAECTGTTAKSGHSKNSLSITKTDSNSGHGEPSLMSPKSSLTTAVATPSTFTTAVATPSSFTTQPPHEEHPTVMGKVVFDFTASSPFELTVEGELWMLLATLANGHTSQRETE